MTTTTGDPSTLKTSATLSSGDFVSRLLAATPPYLYNVPLTPHSFFFSEMLRSFVQAKTEAASMSTSNGLGNVPRRRKRSWRDARDRPLELTTKERGHHHHHHHLHHHQEKYFHQQQTNSLQSQDIPNTKQSNEIYQDEEITTKLSNYPETETLKTIEETKSEYTKQNVRTGIYGESRHYDHNQTTTEANPNFNTDLQKIKPEEQSQLSIDRSNKSYAERNYEQEQGKTSNLPSDLSMLTADSKKLDFSRNFLPGLAGVSGANGRGLNGAEVLQGVKGFSTPNTTSGTEFLPNPLWYPPYPIPPQTYPGIDPLHFFIDLRVSGHIWDRKLSERQQSFKSKHFSAFSVPQAKEYAGAGSNAVGNRPLNLTRDEANGVRHSEDNTKGTNFILKNLTKTYKDIRLAAVKDSRSMDNTSDRDVKDVQQDQESSVEESNPSTSQEEDRKNLRALIGLELVVDYVKDPKPDTTNEQPVRVNE